MARAIPADEARAASGEAVDKNQPADGADAGQAAAADAVDKNEDGSFLDILGIGQDASGEGAEATGDADADSADGGEAVNKGDKVKAKDMLAKLTPILQKLAGAVEKAKDGKASPDTITALGGVAKALRGLCGEEKAEAEKADNPLAAAVAKLTEAVEAVKKAGDGDAPSGVTAKLAAVASSLEKFVEAQKGADDKGDDGKGDGKDKGGKGKTEKNDDRPFEVYKMSGADDADPEILFKAGAAMKRTRLSKLKAIVATLGALVKELEGDEGKQPQAKAVEADLAPVLEKIGKLGDAVGEKIGELKDAIDGVSGRVEKIENMRPAGVGDGDPPKTPVNKSDDEASFKNIFGL